MSTNPNSGTTPRRSGLRVREWVPLVLFPLAAVATAAIPAPWGFITALALGALSFPVINHLLLLRRREQVVDPDDEPSDPESGDASSS